MRVLASRRRRVAAVAVVAAAGLVAAVVFSHVSSRPVHRTAAHVAIPSQSPRQGSPAASPGQVLENPGIASSAPALPSPTQERPGPQSTGVPAGTVLHTVVGTVTVTVAGTVIDAADIKGALIIRASNVVVTRSLIEGAAKTDSVVIESGTGVVLRDDEVAVAQPAAGIDSMHVTNATLDRLNIHGGVDGIKLGSGSTVENSWIHGLSHFAHDPAQGGGPTHNDTIQILSGTNIHIVGNYLDATPADNSAIQVTQDSGAVTGLYISDNWADGGGCTFNISGHGRGGRLLPMSGIFATGNRFGRDMKFAHCAVLVDRQTTLVQSGNVYADTGAAIKITRHN